MISAGTPDIQEHAVRWFFKERQDLSYEERFRLFWNNFGDKFRDRAHYRECLDYEARRLVAKR